MKCPVCLNEEKLTALFPRFCAAKNYLCEKCGLVFIPRSTERVQEYYKDGGYFKKSPNLAYRKILISKSLLKIEAKGRLKEALDISGIDPKNKSVLEIGCGYGEILYVFKDVYSCKVQGIEPSTETAEHGTKLFSVPVYSSLLEEFETNEKFDIIWCAHVLEHTADPGLFLKKVMSLLKKGGLLYIEVPNILKPSGGFNLDMFLYSEHLQTFSAFNLHLVLKNSGFATEAYDDSYFLKFWCTQGNQKFHKEPPRVSAKSILEFLQDYKKTYTLWDELKVFANKSFYFLKIIAHKIFDLYDMIV